MRKLCASAAVLGLVLCSVVPGWAKGIFITPGPRANGFGGAYSAIANDLTAVYWNPAGLAQKKGSGAEASLFYVSDNATSNTSLSNSPLLDTEDGTFPLPRVYSSFVSPALANAEPSFYNSKSFKTSALVPFVAGYTTYKDMTFALAVYASGGGGGKWEDTVQGAAAMDTITASVDGTQSFLVYNLSAAKELCSKCMVGVGIDYITMNDKTDVRKNYSKGTGSPLPALFSGYDMTVVNDAKGSGIQFNAGVIYKPAEKIRTGLTFRSGADITLSGDSRLTQTGLAFLGYPSAFSTKFDQKYSYPMTFALSAAYDPTPKWTIAAGIDQNEYSTMKKDINYETAFGTLITDVNRSMEWKDTTQLRIGAEYRYNDLLALRGGIQTDPAVYTDKLTLLNTNQYDMTYYTIGGSYLICKVMIDLGIAKAISNSPSKGGRSYEYPLNILRLGASYQF